MDKTLINLDKLAAERAQNMVERAQSGIDDVKKPVDTLERLVTKALGVLQSQGIYAMMLFLFSRSGDEDKVATKCIRPQLFEALKGLQSFQNARIPPHDADAKTALNFYSEKILADLDTLLLVRDLYEQTLIYARYHAKAAGKQGGTL